MVVITYACRDIPSSDEEIKTLDSSSSLLLLLDNHISQTTQATAMISG